ncbi:MAG TPA: M20/M25/M40 family metallo-hydrolase [Candidatus Agrococcus pullicola]|uniref:M20/M25/M40 family metallo-hydrolase n=1 Tax=Candidatus Agrococcus pullicola TaxID=2838429 RepID=A0A9D1YS68_9MICO|nr:M20/M25/M40 family metallo-hydrolase [Candidatus Agrococcus pullicola]
MDNNVEVRSGVAERLAALISIPTVSAESESRTEAFTSFPEILRELYPLVHERLDLRIVDGTGLLFTWRGTSGAPPLVLMAHWDVVPASPWPSGNPFEGRIERRRGGYWVVGRGALDDKGPLVVVLEAVENLLAAGFTPAADTLIALGGDEEVMGSNAHTMSTLIREELRGRQPYMVLDEGGAVTDDVLDFVQGRCAMIGLAEKGVATVRLEVEGTGGHASAPKHDEPIPRLIRALQNIDRNPLPARLTRTVRAMLTALRPVSTTAASRLLAIAGKTGPVVAAALARAGGESAALVRTTVAPTKMSAGTADNVLADRATATLNCRILPGSSVRETLEALRRRIRDDAVKISLVEGHDPSPESPLDDRFDAIGTALEESWPTAEPVPYLMMAASDARHFHTWCSHVYRFAPLLMSLEQRQSIHGEEEAVAVDSLVRGERFFRALISNCTGEQER